MDPYPPVMEPRTPKTRKIKSNSNAKLNSRPTPSRARRRYDPQRRLEVAETRRSGACAKCREKKVRCSPAQHKSTAGGTPQSSTDALSISLPSPRDDNLSTHTNNGSNELGGDIMGLEECVKAAKEYLKVAQSHVEQFARFVESWESAQKQSAGSQHANGHITSTPQTDDVTTTGGSPQSSHDSSIIAGRSDVFDSDWQADRIEEVNQILSDLSKNTHIFKDQSLVSPTSTTSPKRKIVLGTKDQNMPLRPKSDLDIKTIHRSSKEDIQNPVPRNRRLRLRGENEPWPVLAPQEIIEHPQRSQTPRPKKQFDDGNAGADSASEHALSWSTQHSPSTPSHRNLPRYRVEETSPGFVETERLDSFSAKFGEKCPSMHLPPTTTPLDETTNHQLQDNLFEGFQFPASESYDNIMDAEFNLHFDFNQEMIQDLDDPFVSPLMTSHTSTPSKLIPGFNQDPLAYLPIEEAAFRTPHQGPIFNSDMNNGSVSSNPYFRTPSSSLRTPSLGSTPSSSMSQGAAPITPRDLVCTPSRKPCGQWQGGSNFAKQDKALGYVNNWSFEDLDSVMGKL